MEGAESIIEEVKERMGKMTFGGLWMGRGKKDRVEKSR